MAGWILKVTAGTLRKQRRLFNAAGWDFNDVEARIEMALLDHIERLPRREEVETRRLSSTLRSTLLNRTWEQIRVNFKLTTIQERRLRKLYALREGSAATARRRFNDQQIREAMDLNDDEFRDLLDLDDKIFSMDWQWQEPNENRKVGRKKLYRRRRPLQCVLDPYLQAIKKLDGKSFLWFKRWGTLIYGLAILGFAVIEEFIFRQLLFKYCPATGPPEFFLIGCYISVLIFSMLHYWLDPEVRKSPEDSKIRKDKIKEQAWRMPLAFLFTLAYFYLPPYWNIYLHVFYNALAIAFYLRPMAMGVGSSDKIIIMHKPEGYITSTKREPHNPDVPVVIELLPKGYQDLKPMGRLDKDTTGILLFKRSGRVFQYLLNPCLTENDDERVSKTYEAVVEGYFTGADIEALLGGVEIQVLRRHKWSSTIAVARSVRIISRNDKESRVEIVITGGKYHQVRSMLDAVGHPVLELKRTVFGEILLGDLPLGAVRELTAQEYAWVAAVCQVKQAQRRHPLNDGFLGIPASLGSRIVLLRILGAIRHLFSSPKAFNIFMAFPFTLMIFAPIYWCCLQYGEVDPALVAVISGIQPIVSYFLAVKLDKNEQASRIKLIGVLTVTCGIILFSLVKLFSHGLFTGIHGARYLPLALIGLLIIYGIISPLGAVFSKRAQDRYNVKPSLLVSLGFGSAVITVMILQIFLQPDFLKHPLALLIHLLQPLLTFQVLFFIYGLQDATLWFLRHYVLGKLGPPRVQTGLALVPVLTFILSYFLGSMGLSGMGFILALFGISLVVFGNVWLVNAGRREHTYKTNTRYLRYYGLLFILIVIMAISPGFGINLVSAKRGWSFLQVIFSTHLLSALIPLAFSLVGHLSSSASAVKRDPAQPRPERGAAEVEGRYKEIESAGFKKSGFNPYDGYEEEMQRAQEWYRAQGMQDRLDFIDECIARERILEGEDKKKVFFGANNGDFDNPRILIATNDNDYPDASIIHEVEAIFTGDHKRAEKMMLDYIFARNCCLAHGVLASQDSWPLDKGISLLRQFEISLLRARIDDKLIYAIQSQIAYKTNVREIAWRLSAAEVTSQIAVFITSCRARRISDPVIEEVISSIVHRSDIQEAIYALQGIAEILRHQKVIPVVIENILQALANADDIIAVGRILTEFDTISELVKFPSLIGAGDYYRCLNPIFREIFIQCENEDLSVYQVRELFSELSVIFSGLPQAKHERSDIEGQMKKASLRGEFSRRILKVDRGDSSGSGFVVGYCDGRYIIITNTHVVKDRMSVTLKTKKGERIGEAAVVLRNKDINVYHRDIALLAISEDEVKKNLGDQLKVTPVLTEFKQGVMATLASGSNGTISTGFLFKIKDLVYLLGAASGPGDSGSPYLVKTDDGYAALAVHCRGAPLGIVFTPGIITDMLRAIDSRAGVCQPQDFMAVEENRHLFSSAREFLSGLLARGQLTQPAKPLPKWGLSDFRCPSLSTAPFRDSLLMGGASKYSLPPHCQSRDGSGDKAEAPLKGGHFPHELRTVPLGILKKGWIFAAANVVLVALGGVFSKAILNSSSLSGMEIWLRLYLSCRFMFSLAVFVTIWMLVFRYLANRGGRGSRDKNFADQFFPELRFYKELTKQDKRLLIAGALCAHVVGAIFFYIGVLLLSPKIVALLFQTGLIFSYFLGKRYLGETITAQKILGGSIVLACIAAINIFSRGSTNSAVFEAAGALRWIGIIVMIACAFTYACQQTIHKSFFSRNPQGRLLTLKFGYGLAIIPLSVLTILLHAILGVHGLPLVTDPLLIFGVALVFPAGYYAMFTAQRIKGFDVSHLAPIKSTEPVVTALLEIVILYNWPSNPVLFTILSIFTIFGAWIAARRWNKTCFTASLPEEYSHYAQEIEKKRPTRFKGFRPAHNLADDILSVEGMEKDFQHIAKGMYVQSWGYSGDNLIIHVGRKDSGKGTLLDIIQGKDPRKVWIGAERESREQKPYGYASARRKDEDPLSTFEIYLQKEGLSQYESLKKCFTPEIIEVLLEDPALRPVFLQVLPDNCLGPLEIEQSVAEKKIGTLAIAEIISSHSIFSVGSPEIADKLVRRGEQIIVGVTDRYSDDTLYEKHKVANGRQVYFPLPDGTWLGVKGAGQFRDAQKPPFYFTDQSDNHAQGLAWETEALAASESKRLIETRYGQGKVRLAEFLAYRRIFYLPDGRGGLVSSEGYETIDEREQHNTSLIFNRFMIPHRCVKLPQLIKADPGLKNIRRRASCALTAKGLYPAGKILSLSEMMLMIAQEMGRSEAAKQNVERLKFSIHWQDITFAGEEADNEEFCSAEELRQRLIFIIKNKQYDLALDLMISILDHSGLNMQGIAFKLSILIDMVDYLRCRETDNADNSREVFFPEPLENLRALFQTYFATLDDQWLMVWLGERVLGHPLHLLEAMYSNRLGILSSGFLVQKGVDAASFSEEVAHRIFVWAQEEWERRGYSHKGDPAQPQPADSKTGFGSWNFMKRLYPRYSPFTHAPPFEEFFKTVLPWLIYAWKLDFTLFKILILVFAVVYVLLHIFNIKKPWRDINMQDLKLTFAASLVNALICSIVALLFGYIVSLHPQSQITSSYLFASGTTLYVANILIHRRINMTVRLVNKARKRVQQLSYGYASVGKDGADLSLQDVLRIERMILGFNLKVCHLNACMLVYCLRFLGEEARLGGIFKIAEDQPFQYITLTEKWGERDILPIAGDIMDYERTGFVSEAEYKRGLGYLRNDGYVARAEQELAMIVQTRDKGEESDERCLMINEDSPLFEGEDMQTRAQDKECARRWMIERILQDQPELAQDANWLLQEIEARHDLILRNIPKEERLGYLEERISDFRDREDQRIADSVEPGSYRHWPLPHTQWQDFAQACWGDPNKHTLLLRLLKFLREQIRIAYEERQGDLMPFGQGKGYHFDQTTIQCVAIFFQEAAIKGERVWNNAVEMLLGWEYLYPFDFKTDVEEKTARQSEDVTPDTEETTAEPVYIDDRYDRLDISGPEEELDMITGKADLKPDEKTVIYWHYWEGLSFNQIGRKGKGILDLSTERISKIHSNALEELRIAGIAARIESARHH
ncbi:MAG: pseudouridine synthase [Candidatus Omnitrophica bacterium]|nr:pseudouridine synthase [Candidatus Omnitrophota bacterium]